MNIGFDIRQARVKGTGIGRYTDNLYKYFKGLKNPQIVFIDGPTNINNSIFEKIALTFWEQFILPILLLFKDIRLYHVTKNLGIPFLSLGKYIITVHDIIPILFPDEYFPNRWKKFSYTLRLKWTVKQSEVIIADSICTKNDLINHMKVPENKIKVIYLGIEDKYRVVKEHARIAVIKERIGIDGKYILGIGSNEPRKNSSRLIRAFNKLKSESDINHKLVIIGKPWNLKTDDLDSNKDVIFTGYVEDADLITLYSYAEVFVFPSLYEGFGLPPLEAMACGLPVITSNSSSLPEIVGDAAVLVDPCSVDDISNAISRVLSDEGLKQELIKKGFDRVKKFKWADTAKQLLQVYKDNI